MIKPVTTVSLKAEVMTRLSGFLADSDLFLPMKTPQMRG